MKTKYTSNLHQMLQQSNTPPKCLYHDRFMIYIPQGHSKQTGNAYSAFYACVVKDQYGRCSNTQKAQNLTTPDLTPKKTKFNTKSKKGWPYSGISPIFITTGAPVEYRMQVI